MDKRPKIRRSATRATLIGTVFACAFVNASAAQAEPQIDDAVDLVQSLYDAHLGELNAGGGGVASDQATLELYFEDGLASTMAQTDLGFDPLLNAQDFDVTELSVGPDPEVPILEGAAQVRATFVNFGFQQAVDFTLVEIPNGGGWQISSIYYPDTGTTLIQSLPPIPRGTNAPEVTLAQVLDADSDVGMEQGDLPGFAPDPGRPDLLFILDGSGSMWGQIDGIAKIETAKEALQSTALDLSGTMNIGLLAYGHRREGDCQDIELMVPVGTHDDRFLLDAIDSVTPRGKTPLAGALQEAGNVFSTSGDRQANILLLSDGLETCAQDPCMVAAGLAQQGINLRVHVVGFDLTQEENEALACIAREGGGIYRSADNADELLAALSDVAAASTPASAPLPEPAAEPVSSLLFEDTFDGTSIASDWTLENAAPAVGRLDGQGAFFASVYGEQSFRSQLAPNRLILNRQLPEGDFDLVVDGRIAWQTGAETLSIAVAQDVENQIVAELYLLTQGCGASMILSLTGLRGGEPTNNQIDLFDGPFADDTCTDGRAYANQVLASLERDGAVLRLTRRGRDLQASVTMALPPGGARGGEIVTVVTEPLSVLRLAGQPTLLAGQYSPANAGESHIWFDRFAIEIPPQ